MIESSMYVPPLAEQRRLEKEAMLLALAALNGLCPEDVVAAKKQLRNALGISGLPKVEIKNPVPEAPMVVEEDPPRLVERQKPIWRGA